MTAPVDAASSSDLLESASLEIEQLANSNVAESHFFPELVAKLCLAVRAEAGAVWLLDPNGMVNRVCESGFDALGLDQNRQASRLNIQYMLDAIQNGESKKARGRQTLVFLNTADGWKIVHEHGTPEAKF